VFVCAWGVVHVGWFARGQIIDTPVYESYGWAVARGDVPYRDFSLEYPPGALPAFVVPALGTEGDDSTFRQRFEMLMFACGAALLLAAAFALAALRAPSRRAYGAVALVGAVPLLLGSVVLSRFDLWPAVLASAALLAFLVGRNRLGAGVLAVAVAAKLYPVVLVPLAGAWVWRRHGRRETLAAAAVFVAVLVAIAVPFFVLAPAGLADSLWRQLRRPLQIETLGAAVLVSLRHLVGVDVEMHASAGSQNIAGAWGVAVGAVQSAVELAALAWLWVRFARGPAEPERFVRYAAGAVLAFVALGKVLSPQFLVWVVPLVALVGGRRGLAAGSAVGAALVVTQLWFPFRYWEYARSFDGTVTVLVLARDLVLVAALALVAWPTKPERAPARTSERARPVRTR
jgi:uncharacterized membrane protein